MAEVVQNLSSVLVHKNPLKQTGLLQKWILNQILFSFLQKHVDKLLWEYYGECLL